MKWFDIRLSEASPFLIPRRTKLNVAISQPIRVAPEVISFPYPTNPFWERRRNRYRVEGLPEWWRRIIGGITAVAGTLQRMGIDQRN